MEKHFCTCPVEKCPKHPANHGDGCDRCIQDNLQKSKMPTCFFRAVHDDVDDVQDFTIKGFVEFYEKHKNA